MRRRDQQWAPGSADRGGSVVVGVSVLDGGLGAPGTIGVLGIPAGDCRIGQGHVELRKQPCVGAQAVALGLGHLGGDLVPVPGRRGTALAVGPKQRLLGLVGRAGTAGGAAQGLDFIDGCGVRSRVQCRRR